MPTRVAVFTKNRTNPGYEAARVGATGRQTDWASSPLTMCHVSPTMWQSKFH